MFNKNDPLIGAVQDVMKRNQAERDAAKSVNEKFGVQDRRALPHERQGEWDTAYKQILSEGLHPNQQKLDVHEPEKDKLTKHDFKMLRNKKKPMEEGSDVTSPSSMGISKPDYATGTPDYAKSKEQTVNRDAKTSLPAGTMKEEEQIDEKAPPGKKYERMVKHIKSKLGKDGLSDEDKSVAYATAWKAKNKKINEGFNNRHDLSVTASDENQVVADQLNEANNILNDKSKFNPRSLASRVRYQGALASKKAKPFTPASTDRLTSEPGNYTVNKLKDQFKTGALAATGNITDTLGITDPKKSAALAKFNPRSDEIGRLAGAATTVGIGPSRAVLKGAEVAASAPKVIKTATAAAKPTSTFTATAKPIQKYANAADELTAGARARFQKTLDAKMAAGGPPAKKPVSQAAREPVSPASTSTVAKPNAISKAIDAANAEKKAVRPVTTAATTAANSGEKVAANVSKYTNKGARGNFTDNLAKARKGSENYGPSKGGVAVRKTTEPATVTRPGVPAIANKPGVPAVVNRPGLPSTVGSTASTAAKTNRLGNALKYAAVGAAVGGAGYGLMNKSQPVSTQAATPKDQSRVPQETPSTIPKPTVKPAAPPAATKPVTPAAKPAAPPAANRPATTQPAQKAAPQPQTQRAPLQSRNQRDDTIGPSGRSTKGPGGVTSGTTTGKTITNKPQAAVKAPVGTGRVK